MDVYKPVYIVLPEPRVDSTLREWKDIFRQPYKLRDIIVWENCSKLTDVLYREIN